MSGRSRLRVGALAVLAVGLVVLVAVPGVQPGASAASTDLAGSQGTNAGLPTTDSAVTVHGRGAFSGLAVTVNQTRNLVNQAVSVSWTGGSPTFSDPSTGAFASTYNGDYLQIFECWGDPQTVNPAGAGSGPLPTQCEFGGESSSPLSSYPISEVGHEYSRVLAEPSWSTYAGFEGAHIPGTSLTTWTDSAPGGTGFVVEPFQGVQGEVYGQQVDYNYLNDPEDPQPFGTNKDYDFETTNEVDFARTYADGDGQQLFQVDTGLEAPGLGCGQDIQPVAGGGTKVPQCWLVVVPRSTPDQEDPAGLTGVDSVVTSPLTPAAWANRIAIPLGFNPVGNGCSASASAEQVVGSELAAPAFASWEPSLCKLQGDVSYQYVEDNDDLARENLTEPTYGSAGMSVFSDPVPAGQVPATNPVVYAPLTLSGVVVAFNIDRTPALDPSGALYPDEVDLSGSRVIHINLTPRLMAKLLTESYQAELRNVTSNTPAGYSWALRNPTSLLTDPDFLQYNPEFTELTTQEKIDAASIVVEESSSDAATAVWRWILADKSAREWLSGVPDPWGMTVNPYYSTNPLENPSGAAFAATTPETFPKSDPYCYSDPSAIVYNPPNTPARPLCVQDWSPYALNMQAAALAAATANDGAKTTLDPSQTANTAWTANGPQPSGDDFVLSITDSASAAQYGLQTAGLSRAGDDGADPAFVVPSSADLLAGEQAMTSSGVAGVLKGDPSPAATDAYPLPLLTYAAATPETLDATDREDYAALLRYTATTGQTSGDQPGQLPVGYVPLPATLRSQALAAAATILHPPARATTSTTTPPTGNGPGTTPGSTQGGSSSGGAGGSTGSGRSTPAGAGGGRSPLGAAALATVRTRGIPFGILRWFLPALVLVGLAAATASLLVGRRASRPTTAAAAEGRPAGDAGDGEPA